MKINKGIVLISNVVSYRHEIYKGRIDSIGINTDIEYKVDEIVIFPIDKATAMYMDGINYMFIKSDDIFARY